MKIYFYTEAEDLETIADAVDKEIADWLAEGVAKCRLVNRRGEETAGVQPVHDWDLGLLLESGRRDDLKVPLAFLYRLAKQHQCEFVVGFFDPQNGTAHKVCYFGHEEGRPDPYEIASYLGLKR